MRTGRGCIGLIIPNERHCPLTRPWNPRAGGARPDLLLQGGGRIDDILVSASLFRAKYTSGYTEMGKEHPIDGSDHRAIILHHDVESFLGIGPPRLPRYDVKLMISEVTSALEGGEHSKIALAYTEELDTLRLGDTGATAVHNGNTVGKRAKEAELAYRRAKKEEGDLIAASNTLSNALGKLLVEAASRAISGQRRTLRRHADWSLLTATHTAALNFLQQSERWQLPYLRVKLSQFPPDPRELMPTPWGEHSDTKETSSGEGRMAERGGGGRNEGPKGARRSIKAARERMYKKLGRSPGNSAASGEDE